MLTREEVDDLESGLNEMLPWCLTYQHLSGFRDWLRLGRRAIKELRYYRNQPDHNGDTITLNESSE